MYWLESFSCPSPRLISLSPPWRALLVPPRRDGVWKRNDRCVPPRRAGAEERRCATLRLPPLVDRATLSLLPFIGGPRHPPPSPTDAPPPPTHLPHGRRPSSSCWWPVPFLFLAAGAVPLLPSCPSPLLLFLCTVEAGGAGELRPGGGRRGELRPEASDAGEEKKMV